MSEPTNSNYVSGAALDDDTSLFGDAVDLKSLSLDSGIDNVTGTISVAESIVSINTPCKLRIGSELIYAPSKSAGDFVSCIRGAGGTTAAAHLSGDAVLVVYSANHFNQLKRATIAIETILGTNVHGNAASLKARLAHSLDDDGYVNFDGATELTISSDAITITQNAHKLQPETGTSDDLSTINGTSDGDFGILYASDFGTDIITIKHNVGNIICFGGSDLSLSNGMVVWYSNGTKVFCAGGASGGFWTLMLGTPTRVSNTTFTVTGDYTNLIKKGMVIKWTESSTTRWGMVSIPSTYSAPDTTVTIIGNTMASIDATSLKYAMVGAEAFSWKFVYAGTVGATGTDVANARYAEEPMIVLGADIQVGTAGTTNNTTIDLNKNGTTMFTTKPTLATTVASSPTPFTADTATTLALGDKATMDIDAIQTTAAIDLYVTLYVFPSRYEFLI